MNKRIFRPVKMISFIIIVITLNTLNGNAQNSAKPENKLFTNIIEEGEAVALEANSLNDNHYDAPDQVVWHAPSKTWFVSNLGGGISLEKDHNGWITQLDQNGKVIHPFWIGKEEGMHAPSGMTITDDLLFVCDRDGVYEIDITKRKIVKFYPIPDAKFINDIVRSSNGDLYVSDFFGNKIYKIPSDTRKAEIWLESNKLPAPDGLYMDKHKLIIACWGVLSTPGTFETSKLGDLLSVD